jgi:hypothetical protein
MEITAAGGGWGAPRMLAPSWGSQLAGERDIERRDGMFRDIGDKEEDDRRNNLQHCR